MIWSRICGEQNSHLEVVEVKLLVQRGGWRLGEGDSSTRCGTHFLSLTAHAVKASTALSAYRSPHRICTVMAATSAPHRLAYSPLQVMPNLTPCSGCNIKAQCREYAAHETTLQVHPYDKPLRLKCPEVHSAFGAGNLRIIPGPADAPRQLLLIAK